MEQRPAPSDATAEILRGLCARSEPWPTARVGLCAGRLHDDRFVHIAALVVFGEFSEAPISVRRYGDYRFAAGTVDAATARTMLPKIVAGDDPFGCGARSDRPFELRLSYEHEMGRVGSGWPEAVARGGNSLGGPSLSSGQPLLAFGQPPFASSELAFRELVLRPCGFADERGAIDQLRIVVPVRDARVEQCHLSDRNLDIQCDGDRISECEVHVLTHDRSKASALEVRPASGSMSFDLDPTVVEATVCLLHRELGLVCSRRVTRAPRPFADGATTALADLRGRSRENERVEFKPFIKQKSDKEAEIVRTLVAFANSGGGRLYVGVTDDGEPQGRRALRDLVKGQESKQTLQELAARIRVLAAERTQPVVQCDIELLEVLDEPVILVTVPVGASRPYANEKGDIHVRRGARSYKADPGELRELFGASSSKLRW